MGEVLEISCVIKNKDCIINLYEYMKHIPDNENLSEKIEIMDNWQYENIFGLDLFDMDIMKGYIENKIILITEQISDGSKGLNIETISKHCYHVEIWYNQRHEYYDEIKKNLLELICKNRIEDICLIAIGKETQLEFDEDFWEMDKKSHNIDVWIISENFFRCKNITTYHEYDIQKRKIDKSVIFILSLQKRNSIEEEDWKGKES